MKDYDHKKIEPKWQKEWKEEGTYKTSNDLTLPKKYVLDMFPYPSGEGLHVGHPRGYIATDVYSRMKRMEGFNVLHPMGWDAFGLPAENFAIKHQIHPREAVECNIARFKEQLAIIGLDHDWSHEIDTTDPEFYRWTQWIFLQMFKKGLAYESHEPINWCPSCQTGLANEDVEADGTCERCGTKVEKKPLRQWVLKITDYADRLLADLDKLPKWPEGVKEAQRNWIGKSEGSEIDFRLEIGDSSEEKIKVFTTRADTLFGVTYVVLAPEHPLVSNLKSKISNLVAVEQYLADTKKKTEMERTAEEKEKTGVPLGGVYAINPANGEKVPVWVADYVLADYGTGAVMAVPAHDERDFAFAKKYNLPIRQVVMPDLYDLKNPPREEKKNTTRETVHVVLRDPAKKQVLIQFLKGEHWKGNEPRNFIIGGMETGESDIETATREIREETGYTNVAFVEKIAFDTQANFFAAHKDVNRKIHVRTLVFDLVGYEQSDIEEDAYFTKDSHEMKWVSYEKVAETITIPDDALAWKYYQTGGFAYTAPGVLCNSGKFDGSKTELARKEITEFVEGKIVAKYKIRDWVFSRQRYWGEPIPLVHCDKCGVVPVSEKDLPILLPDVKNYEPSGTGESPLATITEWMNTKCPNCSGPAKRETNTMPQWAGSSWYYLRYIDPKNTEALVDPKKEKAWMPVDVYVGGDHATRHLIYARFWHKFLFDIGVVSTEEPFPRLEFLGFILASDGRKMSKRWKNIVNPDDVVGTFGADAFRLYEMFIGPFTGTVPWNNDGMVGTRRFVEKVWRIKPAGETAPELERMLHKTIKKVSEDIEKFNFNTAVSAMMMFVNAAKDMSISTADFKLFLQILAPFAPHMTEELWSDLASESDKGRNGSIHRSLWPKYDADKIIDEEVTIAVSINGKVRAELRVSAGTEEEAVKAEALKDAAIMPWIEGKDIKRVIYVPGRLVNIVV